MNATIGIFIMNLLKNKWFWIVVASMIIIIFVLPKIFKNDPSKKRDEKKDQEPSNVKADAAIKELEKEGVRPTYSDIEYSAIAEALFTAVDGCGTDEKSVLNTIGRLKNDLDVVKVIDAFGIRKKTCMGIGTKGTIIELLRSDLEDSPEVIDAINQAAYAKGLKWRL